jgi:glycosyltransferase involved in cell wall biosynthesis
MPLVSVLTPVFNSAHTLGFALASLRAQTLLDWECIVVDDGSADDAGEVVEAAADPRFRFFRLERNCGRGHARQCALEQTRGKYVAMLDADDWIYPDKLSRQVEMLEARPSIAAVSTGMAVLDSTNRLLGVQGKSGSTIYGRMERLGMPLLSFAPTMMHSDLAENTGFDPSLRHAEDADFLLRALLGREYAIICDPLYAYKQPTRSDSGKVSAMIDCTCLILSRYLACYPLRARRLIVELRLKQVSYHLAALFGFWEKVIARRYRRPEALERMRFSEALETVRSAAAGLGSRLLIIGQG